MPRFSTKSLIIAFGLVALWLSTFSGFSAAQDVRRSMLLLALVAVVCLAISTLGSRKVYWTTFAIVVAACGGLNLTQPLARYVPDFAWENSIGYGFQNYYAPTPFYGPTPVPAPAAPTPVDPTLVQPAQPPQISYSPPGAYVPVQPTVSPYFAFRYPNAYVALMDTLSAGWTFALSALGGLVAVFVFSRTRPPICEASSSARQIVEQELQKLGRG